MSETPYSGPPPGREDFDDMHHALGRPKHPDHDCYRNHYCTEVSGQKARRFEALGWWDFSHTINCGRDAIYSVNGAGKQALAEYLERLAASNAAIMRSQKRSREFDATDVGRALRRFENATISYWQADGDEGASSRKLRTLDEQMRAARDELVALLRPLVGLEPVSDDTAVRDTSSCRSPSDEEAG